MKVKKIFFYSFLVLNFYELLAVEQSVIPIMESKEYIENISSKKYSRGQYADIKEALANRDKSIRIVTYNLLRDDYDEQQKEKQYRWPQRLPRVVSLIEEMRADIIGVQEPRNSQIKTLLPKLSATYGFYSESFDNGEYNGIFYKKDRFFVINSQSLSMTLKEGKPQNDMLTILKVKDLKTDKVLAVLNTHLSFSDVERRASQALFIAKQVEEISKEMPVIFMGDLNTFPSRLDLKDLPYYDGDYIHRILTEKVLKDAKEISLVGHLGPVSTFTNNGKDAEPFAGTGTPGVFLDHIYVSKGVKVLIHAVQSGMVEGYYPSDHMPVIADIIIE